MRSGMLALGTGMLAAQNESYMPNENYILCLRHLYPQYATSQHVTFALNSL